MQEIQQKINSLTETSVWIFTKQATDFDDAFRAAQLFNDFYQTEENLENCFNAHYSEYGISTNRHRIWVISQMFGLITKTPFYTKGSQYHDERPTAIFDLLNECEIGDEKYNRLKSEQLLKVRIKPIIDTTKERYDQVVLPLLFSYLALKKLKTEHDINRITIDRFYTYIMTCKRFSEIDDAVYLLSEEDPPSSEYVGLYKDKSRIQSLFSKNSNLIKFEKGFAFINPSLDEYFNNFVKDINLQDWELILEDPNAYAYFLYNCQGFNLNLIDTNEMSSMSEGREDTIKRIVEGINEDDIYDADYVKLADDVKEKNINFDIAKNAFKNQLQYKSDKAKVRVVKNPIFGKIAIQQSGYKCSFDRTHKTFKSKSTGKEFMEAHHLIPVSFAKEIYEKYSVNIDCVENLVSLCPNCHRAVHYGADIVKRKKLETLFLKKQKAYEKINLEISLDELLEMYHL